VGTNPGTLIFWYFKAHKFKSEKNCDRGGLFSSTCSRRIKHIGEYSAGIQSATETCII
jgi:hypothetical protein